jgi:hypothetical protein
MKEARYEIGKDYNLLRPVYGLAILNDVMDKAHTHYYHRYKMTEETHPEETIEGIDILAIFPKALAIFPKAL